MPGFLEGLGQGLQNAGAVLSPEVYKAQSAERSNYLENVARSLQIKKAQRQLDADSKFSEAVGGLQPSAMKDSASMLEALKGVPLDVIADSPRAQQTLQMVSQMQAKEAQQEQRKQQIQLRYDALEQQAEIARQRSDDVRLGIQERAAADKRHQELQAQLGQMRNDTLRMGLELRRDAKEERKQQREDSLLTPEEARFMARQAWSGDTSVMQNIGRGAQGGENVVRLRRAIMEYGKEQGKTPEELAAKNAEFFGIKAGERTLGTRTANIEMAVTEAQNMAPLVLKASEKVDRTRFKDINKIIQMGEERSGDPDVVRLGISINSMVNIYARAINPNGVGTVSDKEHARELLQAAWSKGQINAGVDQLMQELNAARKSPGQVREGLRSAVTGKGEQGNPPSKVVNWGDLK